MTTNEELEALYGPPAMHSDYKVGDHIRYRRGNETIAGEVLWCCAAGPSLTGQPLPLRFFVLPDTGGMPDCVYMIDILGEE